MSKAISYTVQPKDTLGRIASHVGKSVAELIEINHISNPNRLEVGQVIYLDKHYANSVQVMLMDVLRHPIDGLKTLLKFDGKALEHVSDASGLLPLISTASVTSKVEIFVQDSRKEWTKVADTVSGLGQQWLKLISPALKFDLPLLPHDANAAETTKKPTNDKRNPGDGKAKGESIKKNHPVKKKEGKDQNTIVLDVDIPQDLIAYFKLYKDEPIAEEDWKAIAGDLQCEVEVLKAIAKVESGGASAFWKLNKDGELRVPKILYERHYFHRLTCANGSHANTKKHTYHGVGVAGCKSPYDTDPDISWPVGFRKAKLKGTTDEKMSDGKVEQADVYSDSASSYLRLLKAYRKDPNAALKSASWGKFQVMGDNHEACGAPSVARFVQTICSGEKGQVKLLAGFIEKNTALHKAVRGKEWANIASNYNGPSYREFSYDSKLEQAYNEIKKKGTT
jgi:LysM repeat protein